MNLPERIKQLSDCRGITMYTIAQETGISQSTLSRFMNNKTDSISRRSLKILADYFQVSLDWLTTGEGSPYLDSTTERTKLSARTRIIQYVTSKEIPIKEFAKSIKSSIEYWNDSDNDYTMPIHAINKALKSLPELDPVWVFTGEGEMLKSVTPPAINYEYKGAPYYNVDFIGGFDLVLNDQTRNPDYYIDFAPYNKDGVVWCNITGHSMEPELNNGDFIAMKEMTSPIEYLPSGEIYGIVTDDYRTVKRMTSSNKPGFIRLIPTNKSPEFQPQDIPVNIIRKVYAILGSMHRLF